MLALLLLWLLHPLTWGAGAIPLWSPPAGLGLALVAWFGFRLGAIVLATSGVLLLIQNLLRLLIGQSGTPSPTWVAIEAGLVVVEPLLAWWLYHVQARGSRRLVDPRSSTQFVLLVPLLAVGTVALLRTALATLLGSASLASGFGGLLMLFWLDQALGLMVVAPPLLVLVTPLLLRRGLLPPGCEPDRIGEPDRLGVATTSSGAVSGSREASGGGSRWGDVLELAGLTFGASVLSLLLSGLHGRRELMLWQLWGVQMLLIVWASLRQGLRGGTLVAAVAAAVPLVLRQFWPSAIEDLLFQPLLQAHLLAQCGAALLVAAASSWVRLSETGYRQVVSHIPVVIYSARITHHRNRSTRSASEGEVGPSLALRANLDVEVTLVSAASGQLLGVPPESLLGDYKHWLSCVHADDQEVLLAALGQLARQAQPVTCEYRLAGSDVSSTKLRAAGQSDSVVLQSSRKTRWLRDTLAPHRDSEGRLIGWEGVVTDITEQRALADDLRRTTSMFNALVANLPTGVFFIQGPHGQPILLNARARQLLGQREESSAGLDQLSRVYRLFRPDGSLYPAEELPVYLALRQGRTTMRDDIIVHRADGRRVPLVTWAAPVQLRTRGGPDAAVWVLEDLTLLHQAEAARKDAEGHLRTIIETMAEGLLVLDARGRIVNCNPAATSFFGRAAEQLRNQKLFDLGWSFSREDGTPLPVDQHPCEVSRRTGRPIRNSVIGASLEMPNGDHSASRVRWLLVNAMPLVPNSRSTGRTEFTHGGVAGVVFTFSDITAYVQAREGIRASEERYRALVENLPVMLIQSDRDQRVTYINPAVRQVTGYDLADIAEPGEWAALIHADDLPRCHEMNQKALVGQPDRGELRYRASDGSEKVAFAMSQPRTQDGQVIGATTLLVDITRERQLERELQRSQRLELIGRLSSGVAHDFNNLLGVVLNLADLARAHLPADHPVYADLRRISEAGEQAANLATQLLALGRRGRSATRRVEVNQVVRRTLELLRATLPGSIDLQENLADGELFIHVDETQVQQVLMNLCLNARDAMPHGGRLRVSTAREGDQATHWVLLSVEDTGQGMSEEVRERIFEPFFSTKEGGTGLGLAVVQQIVASYGGRIDISSEPGQGTRFDIRWPSTP
jgi:PAS domain S-box-containing protein